MSKQLKIKNPADYFSKLIIIIFALLQLLRLPRVPQAMDIYYHLQVAWGFIQAGGYTNWDFWEYLPLGRPHIYPPLFHILLALLIKLGASVIFLLKFFETIAPVIFLLIIWNFIRKYYGQQLGLFVVVAFGSSFTFFISLANHIPSTLALILGFLSLGEFFKHRSLRAVILLTLCFYTHISVSWFFVLSYIFYALMDKQSRGNAVKIASYSLLMALPLLIFQFFRLNVIQLVGNNTPGQFYLQIKIFDYILAGFGLFLAIRMVPRYRLLVSLFLASSIFLFYPHRFLSAEGYIPVILCSALTLQFIWERLAEKKPKVKKIFMGALIAFILLISPTLILHKSVDRSKIDYQIDWVDSVFSGMLFAKGSSTWFPWAYLPIVDIIQASSDSRDVVYSDINIAGIILSSLAQRATANALLPETITSAQVDPFSISSIIVLSKDLDPGFIRALSDGYSLVKVKENRYFTVFRNPAAVYRLKITKASLGFPVIIAILFLLSGLFWNKELRGLFRKKPKK